MPDPTRPVAAATIATDWGQAVHDRTFAPCGTSVDGDVTNIGGTDDRLDLSNVQDDPGGWLDAANDQLVVPADADGLYIWSARAQIDEISETVRIRSYHNGTVVNSILAVGTGSTALQVPLQAIIVTLAEADTLYFTAQRTTGSGTAEVRIVDTFLVRIGSELGAP